MNARHLLPAHLPGPVDVVTIDVSFISLRLVLPAVPPLLRPGADVVALVKPQFEAGRDEVGRGGLVLDWPCTSASIADVSAAAAAIGLAPHGMTPSPITGATGNQEYLLHLRADTAPATPAMRRSHRRDRGRRHRREARAHGRRPAPAAPRSSGWPAAACRRWWITDTAALIGPADGVRVVSRDDLPGLVDLVVVLGGDGTLLGIADRVGRRGTPHADSRRQLRPARISHRSHAAGDARRPGGGRGRHGADAGARHAARARDERRHRLRRSHRAERRRDHEGRDLAPHLSRRIGGRPLRHQRQGRRADHREPHRLHRLQPCGRRPHRAPRRRRAGHHAHRAAHARATGRS